MGRCLYLHACMAVCRGQLFLFYLFFRGIFILLVVCKVHCTHEITDQMFSLVNSQFFKLHSCIYMHLMVIGIHSMLKLEITFTLHIYKCVCICILKFSFMEFECLSCQYIVIGVLILNKEGHITFCFPLAPRYCAPLFSLILQFFNSGKG